MLETTYTISCDATNRSPLCLGRSIGSDLASEVSNDCLRSGWVRLAPDGPNDPITHLCPVCATGPR